MNNSTIELLDHEPSLRELRQIERRALQGGAWRIEAPRGAGQHDDYADVLALLAYELRSRGDRSAAETYVPEKRKRHDDEVTLLGAAEAASRAMFGPWGDL